MGFQESLKKGNQGEKVVLDILKFHNIESSKNSSDITRSEYDIIASLKKKDDLKIEVKYDYMAQKTNNIAIEVWNTKLDKPSGLTQTKAHIWAHCLKDGSNIVAFICKTKHLQKLVKDFPPKKVIKSGGDNNAELMLYDVDWLLKGFVRLNDLPSGELKAVLNRVKTETWTKFIGRYNK